ncbi:WXG100 family type VII secretion target [Qaidamihabitans albus]|uniref:WXG100 family type VII secretion target n=1 Tax=Qaidamihabitans albus TaxID=2795733 RepID=UPI0018F26D35|nr:WXG100 family type VII secretion target [Qaidamihabitans albus]
MSKTWEEIKPLLDDPYVSADQKELLLASYAHENGGEFGGPGLVAETNPEFGEYYEKYDLSHGDIHGAQWMPTDTVYEQAKAESEEGGYHSRQVQDQIDGNQGELDNARAPGAGTGGVTTSDELFDLAEPALAVFQEFIPIDAEIPTDSRGVEGPLDFQADIQKRFDEQRGIDFQKFLDEAARLREAHGVLEELQRTGESSLNSLYKDWTGAGADASYQKYSEDIAPNTATLLEYLSGGAEVIETAVQTIYEACKAKADEVLALHSATVGSATPDMARKVVTLANGDFDSQDQVLEVAAWVDAECGSNLEATIRADDCDLNQENKTVTITECKKWIRQSFNVDFYGNSGAQGRYLRFKQICDDTLEAVDTAWETLNNYLKEYENEFPESTGRPEVPGPQGPGEQQPSTPSAPQGPGGPSGGGPSGGGPSGGGGGTPPPPEMDKPEAETPEAGAPGKNPVTGEDLELNPETGEPYPIDPATGEAIKDTGDGQDTVTVEKGDHKLELTEPDADGKMGISVDDGSGEPKDYQLDFGEEGPSEEGQGEDFGPQGEGDEVHRPGPDGKIHIEDGPLRITAEQPDGPDGPTVVTVDDGNGEPTTYTLGEAEGQGGAGGAGGGMPRERIGTMPAAGENPFTARGGPDGGAPDVGVPAGGDGAAAAAPGAGGGPSGADTVAAGAAGAAGSGAGGGAVGAGVGGGGGDMSGAPAASGAGDAGGDALNAGAQSGVGTDSASSGAGLGAAPGGMAEPMAAASPQGGAGGGGGGMGMMGGGMGAMGGGGGGQGGGDQERSNPYRIDGGVFDTGGAASRISGSLDDDGDRSIRYDR